MTINLLPYSAKIMADSDRALREFGRACALNAPLCSYATGCLCNHVQSGWSNLSLKGHLFRWQQDQERASAVGV